MCVCVTHTLCVCLYVCVYVSVCVFMCVYVFVHIRLYVCMCTFQLRAELRGQCLVFGVSAAATDRVETNIGTLMSLWAPTSPTMPPNVNISPRAGYGYTCPCFNENTPVCHTYMCINIQVKYMRNRTAPPGSCLPVFTTSLKKCLTTVVLSESCRLFLQSPPVDLNLNAQWRKVKQLHSGEKSSKCTAEKSTRVQSAGFDQNPR